MEVRSRAPGKVILCGEHAVVHGSTAVAASINLCTNISFRPASAGSGGRLVELELKDTDVVLSWPTERLKEVFSEIGSPAPLSPQPCSPETMELIYGLYEEQKLPEAKAGLASGISAFIYLYTSIQGFKPGRVVVSSDLPLGGGLGSSASFCVSLCGALLAFSGAVGLQHDQNSWFKLGRNDLELVNKWAFEGEKIIHGKPSGIDNTVSTFGNMIMFRSGELTQIEPKVPLRMLITNTRVERNTKALVVGVSARASRHPHAMASVFAAVDSISKELSEILQSPAPDAPSISAREDKIGELMEMNQGLLQCMGVSHASIEDVLRTTLKYNLISKLTGAGGGGCVLTLLPTCNERADEYPETKGSNALSSETVGKVMAELEPCGFQCFATDVGGRGLEILVSSSSP